MKKSVPVKPKRRSAASSRASREGNRPPRGSAFPVVGVGASAGGLEAFSRLLSHLPETTNMAFVFVQHLDPTHRVEVERRP